MSLATFIRNAVLLGLYPRPSGGAGDPGQDGLSAYEVAQQNGFSGTEAEWLASLKGDPGDDGDPGADGQNGTNGAAGASAYQVAVAGGFVGTEAEWLLSLKGEAGADGANGSNGAAGDDGREIELQKSATHVQWRYVGDAGWTNLVALADITGPAGADGEDGAGGAPMLTVPLVADAAGLTLTNMALALAFLGGSHRYATKVDLTNFTQVRLVVNKQATAGAAAAKIILRYIGAFSTTVGNWLDIGATEVSVAINVQNTVLATAWINLADLAKADLVITPVCSGGDGALDPVIGSVVAQFK